MSSLVNDDAFVTKNAGFVLKLRLVGVGGAPQIRRVKLNRLVVSGGVSFEALVGLAIQYTFPDAPLLLDDYEVALTYYDVDNDCVTIASTEELVDAVDQFSSMSPPVLRLTTDVKRKKHARVRPTPPSTPKRAGQGRNQRQQRRRGDSPGRQATQQLQTLLESFVGILATAVVALQTHMNPPPAVPTSTARSATAAAATSTPTTPSVASPPTTPTDASTKTEESGVSTPFSEASQKLEEAKLFVKEVVENINMEKKPEEGQKESSEERPFIHGRHTCDACLVTPIIGTRYHATNLPDYDLCSNCKGNYKGNEIQFEPAELDRDRPFQERWTRRRARWAGGRGHCRPHRRASKRFAVPPGDMDAVLKESIRRSLQEAKSAAEEAKKEVPEKEEPKQEEEPEKVEEPKQEEESKKEGEVKNVDSESKNESFASAAVGSGATAEVLGHTLDQCAEAIDAMMTELSRGDASDEDKQPLELSAPVEETDIPRKEEEEDVSAMTSSVPSVLSNSEPELVAEPIVIEAECVNAPVTEEGQVVSETPVTDNGATILESTEQDTTSQASEDDWQVVTDDAQVAGDEMLARAFQLIGSALFQSEMNNSAEAEGTTPADVSEMESSSSSSSSSDSDVSSAVSIPSTVPSISSHIPLAQQARWAAQLGQLRELGFENEKECVEVLERLHAANIGVDEDEEVSVTHVVNEMLKKND